MLTIIIIVEKIIQTNKSSFIRSTQVRFIQFETGTKRFNPIFNISNNRKKKTPIVIIIIKKKTQLNSFYLNEIIFDVNYCGTFFRGKYIF